MNADEGGRRRAALFHEILRGLPREGPGDRTSTVRALNAVSQFTAVRRVADIGCGPGAQTIQLATATEAHIVAIDMRHDYLEQLCDGAGREGVLGRVHPVHGSMFDLPIVNGTMDVVWAEGAIYIIGFERGLREWRRRGQTWRLRGGDAPVVAREDVPDEPRRFWVRQISEHDHGR